MIHEYALDPAVLSTWANFRYFVDQFGISHGRLISRFPSKWKKLVYESASGASPIDRKRIEERLTGIDGKLLDRSRDYDGTREWVPNAVASHVRRPFRMIISTPERAGAFPVVSSDLVDETTAGWAPGVGPIARSAAAMANAAATLLESGSEILFVDPHFSCAARHFRPLVAFLNTLSSNRRIRRLEYHLRSDATGTSDWFEKKLADASRLRRILVGRPLVFVRWQQLPEGDGLHARYILSERGGIWIDVGLDEGQDGETTDVGLLAEEIHRVRLGQFSQTSAAFKIADAWAVSNEDVVRVEPDGRGQWVARRRT